MKPGLLVLQQRSQQLLDALGRDYAVHDYARAEDRDALIGRIGGDIRAVLTNGRGGISGELIDALANLEIVCCFGVGYEMVDMDRCRARGITVTNAPGTNDVGVAEMAILLMLAVTRKIVAADAFVKQGRWPDGRVERTHTIGGKKLGIVGLGRIGRKIAERAEPFDMEIAWHGPNPKPDAPWRYMPDLMALADWADYLVAACPGGAETHHLISAPVLHALGPGGIFVNIARGTVADPDALTEALRDRTIFGAGLDVFEGEPAIPEAIRALDNVIMTPHIGAITHEAFDNGLALLQKNLAAHFTGKKVLTPVHVPGE